MHGEASNVIRMGFKRRDLLVGVVVEDAKLVVVRSGNEPVLPRDELGASHRHFSNLEGPYKRASLVVVDVHAAIVKSGQQPWLCRVEIDRLDSVRAGEELFLQISGSKQCPWRISCWTYGDLEEHDGN